MKIELPGGVIYNGDCLEILKDFPDNSVDSLVTDPPYGLSFMGKKWDYDVPSVELWQEVLRVLKPGGHGLVACGTRTQHRMAVNLEDAGFEIRDVIIWCYGSGFPKSLNIGKILPLYEGYGTALKPAVEFFTLVRKPISEKNIAENVLRWGTGGINIDGCRVGSEDNTSRQVSTAGHFSSGKIDVRINGGNTLGRFPANLIHDGSDEVLEGFPETKSGSNTTRTGKGVTFINGLKEKYFEQYGDQGSAARFFYCAKASASERNEGLEDLEGKNIEHDFGSAGFATTREGRVHPVMKNFHPTVKPIALMQYLCRLITPKGGTVLDPFAGSGTTGIAAVKEGKEFILIEREPEYIEIAAARVNHNINKIEPDLFTAAANA